MTKQSKHFNVGNTHARKDARERRTERVTVYFTPGESVRYQSQADKAGVPIAQWIRMQLAQLGKG